MESAERLEIIRDISTARLRELVQAEQDGRLVVLPCKVGDTVYFALLPNYCPNCGCKMDLEETI